MKRWLPLVLSGFGALLLLTAGGWIFGIRHLWAFSFLLYVPLPLRLLLGALVLAAALLPLRVFTLRPLLIPGFQSRTGSSWVASIQPNHRITLWLLLAGLLFWFGRERTYHGDALLKLQLLATQTLRTDPYVWKEPLDSLSTYTLTALIQRWQGTPATAIALLSVLAGVIYGAAVMGIAGLLAITRLQQLSYFVALFALGSSQLWFGHIENYSLVTATTFVTITLAVGYLQARVRLIWVGLAAGLAVSFHPQALFAMPALLVLAQPPFHQAMNEHSPTKGMALLQPLLILGGSALVIPLLTVGLLWWNGAPLPQFGNGFAGDPQLFWHVEEALAPVRLLDALNNLWLIAPLAPFWLFLGAWGFTQPKLRQDPIFCYLSAVIAGLLCYHFAFQNDLPRWRDWDLFAIAGPALTLWGMYSWWAHTAVNHNRQVTPAQPPPGWRRNRNSSDPPIPTSKGLAAERGKAVAATVAQPVGASQQQWLLPALTFATLFTIAWIGVNHYRILLRPNADQRDIYRQYQLLDLREALATATITPDTPICAEATGCERVSATTFTMPQDGDERPAIFAHAPVQLAWSLDLPAEPTFLWLSPALDPVAWGWGGDGVTFAVVVRRGAEEETLWSRHLAPTAPNDRDWQEIIVDLSRYSGQSVTLILVTAPGMADNNAGDRAGWGMPWLMRGTVDRRFDQH